VLTTYLFLFVLPSATPLSVRLVCLCSLPLLPDPARSAITIP
jgi:hypothetical protein